MLVIGLTGGIGTGKTKVAEILRGLGADVISADEVGHDAYKPKTEGWDRIVATFGKGVIGPDGEVDRKKLGAIVFSDPEALERLNAIVHPLMLRMMQERIARLAETGSEVAVVEAAILLEAGWASVADEVWVTTAPEDLVVARVQERSRLGADAIRARIRSQMPQSQRIKHADAVIPNGEGVDELERRVRQLWSIRVAARKEKTTDS